MTQPPRTDAHTPDAQRTIPPSPAAAVSAVVSAEAASSSAAPHPSPAGGGSAELQAALIHARSKLALLVDARAAGNPVLRHVHHVRKEVAKGLRADFICGPTTCMLYLSLQYHILHPEYIYKRTKELGRSFRIRVLLAVADVHTPAAALRELASHALLQELTLIVARDDREAARYIESFRAHGGRDDAADLLRGRPGLPRDASLQQRVAAVLGNVRAVTAPDAAALVFNLGAFRNIADAGEHQLRKVPGFGDVKVARLHAALHAPFRAGGPARVDDRDLPPDARVGALDADGEG